MKEVLCKRDVLVHFGKQRSLEEVSMDCPAGVPGTQMLEKQRVTPGLIYNLVNMCRALHKRF